MTAKFSVALNTPNEFKQAMKPLQEKYIPECGQSDFDLLCNWVYAVTANRNHSDLQIQAWLDSTMESLSKHPPSQWPVVFEVSEEFFKEIGEGNEFSANQSRV